MKQRQKKVKISSTPAIGPKLIKSFREISLEIKKQKREEKLKTLEENKLRRLSRLEERLTKGKGNKFLFLNEEKI